MTDLFFN